MERLPLELFKKIMSYNSHPISDLLRNDPIFKAKRYETERTHGCPFDRGGADSYYYRYAEPHKWTNGNGRDGGRVEEWDLTDDEIEGYWMGYLTNTTKKNGDDDNGNFNEIRNKMKNFDAENT